MPDSIATSASQLADFDYHVDRVAGEIFEQMPVAQDGTVIGGSYDKTTGSVEVLWGDTYSILADDPPPGDTFINHQKLPQFTMIPGFQYGPTGVERVVAIPSPSGFGVIYKHYSDDSPQAPAGEVRMYHKTVASQTQPNALYDSGASLTNDGTNTGDGKGGARWGYNADWTQVNTKSGHILSQSDTNKQLILKSSGGHTLTYNDPGNVPGNDQGVTLQTIGNMLDSFDDTTKTILRQPVANLYSSWNGSATTITHQVVSGVFSLISGANGSQYIQEHVASGLQTVIDGSGTITGLANSISHVVPTSGIVSLGAFPGASNIFPAATTGGSGSDLYSLVSDGSTGLNIQRLQDMRNVMAALASACSGISGFPSLGTLNTELFVTIMGLSGVPSLPGFSAYPVPAGSQVVQVLQHH